MGLQNAPHVFTVQRVAPLSSVLNSPRAITVNIRIIRAFTRMRELLLDNLSIKLEIENIKKTLSNKNNNIELVFNYFVEFIEQNGNLKPRIEIGYKKDRN